MENYDVFVHNGLFQIGEVARCCGVDRQTILFYEKQGLLKPTAQNESSGYRYYSAEAVTELMQVLELRDAGLPLREIRDFIKNGAPAAQRVIAAMEEKLEALLSGLEQMRAISVIKGDYTVSRTTMPAMRCFVREYVCHGVEESVTRMYEAFHAALREGLRVRNSYRAFTEYPEEIGGAVNLTNFPLRVCIPVAPETQHPDCVDIPAICGVAVCHRGAYEQIGAAYDTLWEYVRVNGLRPIAPVRECYLDSRREYQNNADRYVTRLVLPVQGSSRA